MKTTKKNCEIFANKNNISVKRFQSKNQKQLIKIKIIILSIVIEVEDLKKKCLNLLEMIKENQNRKEHFLQLKNKKHRNVNNYK